MAIVDNARGTANILSNRIVVDMSDKIAMLKPRTSPLTTITRKLAKKPAMNYKFEWMEDKYMSRWTQINNAGGYLAGATSVVVDDGSIIAVGDLIKIIRTAEILKVTAVSTNTLTVTRAYGETSAAAINDDDKVVILGNANLQGSGAPAEKYATLTAAYNYTQIFKTPFAVTNTLDATELYGMSELTRLQAHKGVEHAESVEYSFLFGERKLDTSGAQPLSTTRGILKFLAGGTNATQISKSTGTQKDLDGFFEKVFTNGSSKRVWFCSPGMITWVNQLAQGKVQIISASEQTFGLDIMRYQTPHGTMDMVLHQMLVNGYADYSFALDMEHVYYRPLKGRDTKLMTNIQNNDEDGRRDMYQTEAGLELRLPDVHGVCYLV